MVTDLEHEHEQALAEIARLRRWKAEANEVILGLQDVGKALGLRRGERITGQAAAEAAQRLTARAEAAEAKVARVEALAEQWERGYNSPTASSWASVHAEDLRVALDGGS